MTEPRLGATRRDPASGEARIMQAPAPMRFVTSLAMMLLALAACEDSVGTEGSSADRSTSGGRGADGTSEVPGVEAGSTAGADAGPKAPRKTDPKPLTPSSEGFYPRAVIRSNGTIVASVVRFLPSQRMGATIFESTDDGVSFEEIGAIDDPINQGGLCCGTLYELPKQVGTMPAGTLLWSASSGGDTPNQPMTIPVWKSNDGGRTWVFVSKVVTAAVPRSKGGLWEPEFSLLDDGSLVCHWSDETDPAHSQKLVEARSVDGVSWGDHRDTVAVSPFGHRPGMPNVRRAPGGPFVMSYEICGVPSDSCTAWIRTSNDGWSWGDPRERGIRPTTVDGKHFRHAPTLAWSAAPGTNGRFFMVGQVTHLSNGTVAPENGKIILASSERGNGNWYPVPAPVPVPDAHDNFCPNYSSTLLPLENGTVGLEIASRWDGNVCRSYFARGPLIDTSDGSEIADGATVRLVSLHSGHCLDVAGGSSAAGANVQQWTCNDSAAQRWVVKRAPSGDLSLRSSAGMCLTVAGNSTKPGANVEQRPCDGPGHSWKLRAVGTGHYELIKAGSTVCLDVAGGAFASGANVAQWTCNDLAPQIWKIEPR